MDFMIFQYGYKCFMWFWVWFYGFYGAWHASGMLVRGFYDIYGNYGFNGVIGYEQGALSFIVFCYGSMDVMVYIFYVVLGMVLCVLWCVG